MLKKARIAVLVSGGGTNLQALLDAQQNGTLQSGEIALVLSCNPDAYALKRAEAADVPAVVAWRAELGSAAAFEAKVNQYLEDYRIDLVVLAGFLQILSADFTRKWDKRIINVHPSLIPAFCGPGFYGLLVHQAALERGVKIAGATVHFVNEITDGGEIILQKAVDVLPGDTPELLQKRVMEQAEWIILPQAAEMVSARIAQNREEK